MQALDAVATDRPEAPVQYLGDVLNGKKINVVLFVFQTFTAWGKKAIVVQNAAKKPIYFNIKFNILILRGVLLPGAPNPANNIQLTIA